MVSPAGLSVRGRLRRAATALNSQLLLQPSCGGGGGGSGGGGGRTIQHGCGGGRDHRTQDAGERAGNARLRAGPGRSAPPPTPRPAHRAGSGPAHFRPGRGRVGGGGDRACGPLLPCWFLRGLGRAAAVCQKQKWPARVLRTHTLAKRLCGPRSPFPGMALIWGAQKPDVLTAGQKDLETEDGKVTRSPVLLGRSCRTIALSLRK
ncbi:uncharacterized protein LOC144289178 [Canis aureus]